MKLRFDFVSNSSSCSFVVNDLKAFNEKLRVLSRTKDGKDVDTYWMYGLNIRFNFKRKHIIPFNIKFYLRLEMREEHSLTSPWVRTFHDLSLR